MKTNKSAIRSQLNNREQQNHLTFVDDDDDDAQIFCDKTDTKNDFFFIDIYIC